VKPATALLTLSEAAGRLRVSIRTVEREAADGRLAIVRVRSRRLVDSAELDRYITAQVQPWQSERREPAGKSESAQALAAALSSAFRPAPPGPTRRRSKLLSESGSSALRLAESTTR
jgi:excisionase family DNA binding protein